MRRAGARLHRLAAQRDREEQRQRRAAERQEAERRIREALEAFKRSEHRDMTLRIDVPVPKTLLRAMCRDIGGVRYTETRPADNLDVHHFTKHRARRSPNS